MKKKKPHWHRSHPNEKLNKGGTRVRFFWKIKNGAPFLAPLRKKEKEKPVKYRRFKSWPSLSIKLTKTQKISTYLSGGEIDLRRGKGGRAWTPIFKQLSREIEKKANWILEGENISLDWFVREKKRRLKGQSVCFFWQIWQLVRCVWTCCSYTFQFVRARACLCIHLSTH